jgi:hypothetical protein
VSLVDWRERAHTFGLVPVDPQGTVEPAPAERPEEFLAEEEPKAFEDQPLESLEREGLEPEAIEEPPEAGLPHDASGSRPAPPVSASMRAYLGGANTVNTRKRLVTDYVNSVPLGATAGYGEVIGLGDGLQAWYGADAGHVNTTLMKASTPRRPRLRPACRSRPRTDRH